MGEVKHKKVVASLPDELTLSTLYYVRVGDGFDLYLTNEIGEVMAYKLNKPYTSVSSYVSDFSIDGFLYKGYIVDSTVIIKRLKDNLEQVAINVTNLPNDWANRMTLTYT